MNEPRMIPIHRSLNRPHLMLGAERGLVMFCALITAMIAFSGSFSLLSLGIAVLFWFVSFWSIVQMAKADPIMSKLYQRHIRYRSYYNARGCLYAELPAVPKMKD